MARSRAAALAKDVAILAKETGASMQDKTPATQRSFWYQTWMAEEFFLPALASGIAWLMYSNCDALFPYHPATKSLIKAIVVAAAVLSFVPFGLKLYFRLKSRIFRG